LKNKVELRKAPKSKKIKTIKPKEEPKSKVTRVVELKEALKNKGKNSRTRKNANK
jgi:hypothetical protein